MKHINIIVLLLLDIMTFLVVIAFGAVVLSFAAALLVHPFLRIIALSGVCTLILCRLIVKKLAQKYTIPTESISED